jgi:hypothetical protein
VQGDPQPLLTVTPTTEEELAFEAELVKAEEEAVAFVSTLIDTVQIDDDC